MITKNTADYVRDANRFKRAICAACLVGFLAAAPRPAMAVDVKPNAGITRTLGNTVVSVYYQPVAGGYRVVTTTGSGTPQQVLRFVSTLSPGQEAVVMVPRNVGQAALELHLKRIGDRIELEHNEL